MGRLYIDAEAGILDEKFHEAEGGTEGEMHRRIGSTGEGVGPARVARINRDLNEFRQFKHVAEELDLEMCMVENTPRMIADMQDNGENILIEGTQGSGLSLLHSHYPYCTSIDTNAAGIISEVEGYRCDNGPAYVPNQGSRKFGSDEERDYMGRAQCPHGGRPHS